MSERVQRSIRLSEAETIHSAVKRFGVVASPRGKQ